MVSGIPDSSRRKANIHGAIGEPGRDTAQVSRRNPVSI
jgi:hypothetical protein